MAINEKLTQHFLKLWKWKVSISWFCFHLGHFQSIQTYQFWSKLAAHWMHSLCTDQKCRIFYGNFQKFSPIRAAEVDERVGALSLENDVIHTKHWISIVRILIYKVSPLRSVFSFFMYFFCSQKKVVNFEYYHEIYISYDYDDGPVGFEANESRTC